MSAGRPVLGRVVAAAFTTATVLVAARLFVPAASLTFSRQSVDAFNATGLPSWSRLALALPEMFGAVLLAVPTTFYVGAAVLLLDLTGAIAAHRSLGMRPTSLYVLLAAVAVLAVLRRHALPWKLSK
jgi:hypothetical protein